MFKILLWPFQKIYSESSIIANMLVDEAIIKVSGGHGGPGKISFGAKKRSGPDGGNGGHGGDVYIVVTSDLTALAQFIHKKEFEAPAGTSGDSNRKSGKDGEDLEIIMPLGTEITDETTKEVIVLDSLDKRILISKGGLGGKGNYEFRSPTNTTPRYAQPGLSGEERILKLDLKLIADFGLIGLPNAGKSSLLNELTRANAKVGDYPFTTTEANLGVLEGKIIADIPGLIEGASAGKGLGIKFLKHIERVTALLHCIALDSLDVVKDYKVIRKELMEYNSLLAEKKEIILLTKMDLVDKVTLKKQITKLEKLNKKVVPISVYDYEGLEGLKKLLASGI
jgi:GTPase